MPEDYAMYGGAEYHTPTGMETRKVTVNAKSTNQLTEQQFQQEVKDYYMKPEFEEQITALCMEIAKFLISKNTKYGNSALEPLRTFSKLSSEEQLLIRMDDKLSRIKNAKEPSKNDIIDLIGYLHLYALKKGWTDLTEMID